MREEKYNGWTNYATWRVNLEMFDDDPQLLNTRIRGIPVAETTELVVDVTAEDCKDYAETIVGEGADGFALDYALAFLQEVNWREIAEHLNEND